MSPDQVDTGLDNRAYAERLYQISRWATGAILVLFILLYIGGLASGMEPEMGLMQAGAASIVLAVISKVALGILEATPPVDPIQDDTVLDELDASIQPAINVVTEAPAGAAESLSTLPAQRTAQGYPAQ